MCTVENDQSIGERKNMNLPNVKVDLPVLQPKDIDDLQNFGVKRTRLLNTHSRQLAHSVWEALSAADMGQVVAKY